ncbi:hypothetical protein BFI45_16505 [Yersinia pestis subsp. microtus bv. Altaica]|nr:amino acid permease family protein [Yersinia pestis str. Pestoides B]EEO92722.1 Histidine transport protein (permease) [Yersinia pestis Pestoides A]OVY54634.1 hypothetical protein BFI45_16505 [Yersinia pestis subsp. microtus bv. Altaica]OVY75059.1 hypothetical protein BFI50_15660 [Yersinia pestis subsp. microtus bv. Xilingolensis]OVY55435.1 hypothetical protein BFI46_16295 [Yersinia pestis subsp. microtus bv. Altaica]
MKNDSSTLKRGLSARHIRFMALGSAIGTGLFYGSAEAIRLAGPAVLLAYLCNERCNSDPHPTPEIRSRG